MLTRRLIALILFGGAVSLGGCSVLAGYEPFEFGAGGAGGAGAGADANEGKACSADGECGALVCLYGLCRKPCKADLDCDKTSICLGDQVKGGCRLLGDTETQCSGTCSNVALSCSIDQSCRTPCVKGEKECPFNGQECIQGTCVSNSGSAWETTWGLCPGLLKGELSGLYCDGLKLKSCNVDKNGVVDLGDCATAELCQAAVTKGLKTCPSTVCDENEYRCDGVQLQRCNAARSGYEKAEDCASGAICTRSKDTGKGVCLTPKCGQGGSDPRQNRCVDGVPEQCEEAQQAFVKQAPCKTTERCNPANGQCVPLAIDATEVTRGEYATFASKTVEAKLPSVCGWNKDYHADQGCIDKYKATVSCLDGTPPDCVKYPELCNNGVPLPCDSFPQTCIDWCDAYDYCASKGQHLCGRLGKPGVMVPAANFADAGQSEWMNACSAGGENAFVMEGTNPSNSCNGETYWSSGVSQPLPVKNASKCVSPEPSYAGVFDLSGNVSEWENSCATPHDTADPDGLTKCQARGGSFNDDPGQPDATGRLRCNADRPLARNERLPSVGFRCCGP